MNKNIIFFCLIFLAFSCKKEDTGILVKNEKELKTAISNAKAGNEIVLANGVWKDIEIRFKGEGEKNKPITLKAETAGKVFIEGKSDLKLGGKHLVVEGLYFRNGYTPSGAVIEFKINSKSPSMHCRVTNCVIEGFNQPQRDRKDHWVEFWGRHNQLDHCYLTGKSNQGPTIRVKIKGIQNINNYHQIVDNHFGPRPRRGGPRGETIQIGDSYSSVSPSYTSIANNLFEKCNGEVEVISNKTNFNEFRNNVFYKCEGSLVMRHGNYCKIDGNYFIGDENSENIGGIRIINTGHWVTNNYFYNLKGKEFRSPLAVMNGIPKSPQNRYNQVTDVVVAYNTWVNCKSPWQFGVGTNISQKDVLPKSEIRSARPVRTTVANNVIYNEKGDNEPIIAHDKIDGVDFHSNLINNQGVDFTKQEGLNAKAIQIEKVADYIFVPQQEKEPTVLYAGFEFETITNDLFGNSRSSKNAVGAVAQTGTKDPMILDKKKYGTNWFDTDKKQGEGKTISLTAEKGNLSEQVAKAECGDIIELSAGTYQVKNSLVIDKHLTFQAKEGEEVKLTYTGEAETPLFSLQPKGNLTVKGLTLAGENTQYAFATLKKGMSSLYNLTVVDSKVTNFDYILKAYKESFADQIVFKNTKLESSSNGIELSEETNDKGDYNVEFLYVDNCHFENIPKNVIDYYRGGYDESTIGGNLSVTNSTFVGCGANEENNILLNTRGIINVNIEKNTFSNNPVKLVALLWGAKNNKHSDNRITNSGKLIVEENLKLKLLY